MTAPLEGIILTPTEASGLCIVQGRPVLDIFTAPGVVPAILEAIRQEATRDFVVDLATDKGRKAVAAQAYKVTKTKTYLDGLGKDEVARLKELPRLVDAGRKELRDGLDALAADIRRPLTELEQRQEAAKARLTTIQNLPGQLFTAPSGDIRAAIKRLEATDPATFEDLAQEAAGVIAVTRATLLEQADKAEKREAEVAELERLRAEKAERDRQDREEALRKEGEERARQALAASSVPAVAMMPPAMVPMLEQAMDAAGVPAAPAIQNPDPFTGQPVPQGAPAAPVAPQPGQAAAALLPDVEHRRAVNRAALAGILPLVGGDEDMAKGLLLAIVKGQVPHVRIAY